MVVDQLVVWGFNTAATCCRLNGVRFKRGFHIRIKRRMLAINRPVSSSHKTMAAITIFMRMSNHYFCASAHVTSMEFL